MDTILNVENIVKTYGKKINIKRWTGDISLNVSLSIPEKKSTLKNVIQSLNMEYPSDNPYAHFFSR